MFQTCDIAVLDAASLAGENLLRSLEESVIETGVLYPLSAELEEGAVIEFQATEFDVLNVETFNFADATLFFVPAGSKIDAEILNRARDAGCMVINGGKSDASLVLPGLNEELLGDAVELREVAIPSSAAGLLLKLLKPVQESAGIDSVNIVASMSVSSAGQKAVEELRKQTIDLLSGKPVSSDFFPQRAAFNLIPQVGSLEVNGSTDTEAAIAEELMAGLGSEDLRVSATCVTAPVFFGDSLAVHLDLDKPVEAAAFSRMIITADKVEVLPPEELPTIETAAGADQIQVGRIRQNPHHADQLSFWLAADGVRSNANNAVAVAEILLKDFLKC
ncbi:hypothetical protein EOPP23_18725 [Endozoicomonas sp. OPT23]|uniref:Asd/ArgC dimerization domain-containing protein n=1 Tax=Endozoicomonas sp. OPT23 TaxID=2072845 RepID=UPI00129AC7E5|nr:Asd/ArgC dimerization domain-containing protein [Endozoicomonas sp. OPT23]MRI35014.1 hypothetical protein [Endozoicomonas sp. OPT23]